jgi:hypothetical protein
MASSSVIPMLSDIAQIAPVDMDLWNLEMNRRQGGEPPVGFEPTT